MFSLFFLLHFSSLFLYIISLLTLIVVVVVVVVVVIMLAVTVALSVPCPFRTWATITPHSFLSLFLLYDPSLSFSPFCATWFIHAFAQTCQVHRSLLYICALCYRWNCACHIVFRLVFPFLYFFSRLVFLLFCVPLNFTANKT